MRRKLDRPETVIRSILRAARRRGVLTREAHAILKTWMYFAEDELDNLNCDGTFDIQLLERRSAGLGPQWREPKDKITR